MNVLSKVFFVFFCAFIAQSANAQMGNWHSDVNHCREVYDGGQARPYGPAASQIRAAAKAATAGVTRAPLPQPACINMLVADGRYHTIFLPQGTEMLWKDGRPFAHPVCGNPIQGDPLWLTPQPVYSQGGTPGAQGSPGRDGRNGVDGVTTTVVKVVMPPAGASFAGYSGYELTRDLGHDIVWGAATVKVVDRIGNTVDRRTQGRVDEARLNSQRGPSHLTIQQNGNCNAALGATSNCTQLATREVTREVVVDRPVYIDRPVHIPAPPRNLPPAEMPSPAQPPPRSFPPPERAFPPAELPANPAPPRNLPPAEMPAGD